jgi:DNA-binding response OmpR family regulator
MADTSRLAIVDDDTGFVQVLVRRVEARGWRAAARPYEVAVEDLVAARVDTLVVDVACVGADYVKRVRAVLPEIAIVVCAGPSSVGDRVRGLRAGADDWLTKPCHPEELLARVEAIARRRRPSLVETPAPLGAGELEVRPDRFEAYVRGEPVGLTRREFEVLHLLAAAEGRVLEREEVYRRVWGYEMAHGDRSVDVFVRKVRGKIARRSSGWTYVHTHFGVGYRFAAVPDAVPAELEAARPSREAARVRP